MRFPHRRSDTCLGVIEGLARGAARSKLESGVARTSLRVQQAEDTCV